MNARTVMTHAPSQPAYMATLAPAGASCWVPTCRTTAIHVMLESMSVVPAGEALCAYHSPFDRGSVRVAPAPVGDAEWLASPSVLASGVSLGKATDPAMVYRPEPAPRTGDVVLTGADGSWVTRESRATVESWRADSIRVGAYEMAAAWGMVLRGEA